MKLNENTLEVKLNDLMQDFWDLLSLDSQVLEDKESGLSQVSITVANTADEKADNEGGDIVFIGVGLRIINHQYHGSNATEANQFTKSHSLKTSEIEKNEHARNKYNLGTWISGTRFPPITPNEESFGTALFPGESIVYTMDFRSDLLSDYEIKVEGQLSRRHLFHFSKTVKELEEYSRPLILAGLKALIQLDIVTHVQSYVAKLPEITPDSTLRDLETANKTVNNLQAYLRDELLPEINSIYRSTPHNDIHSYIKSLNAQYIKFIGTSCDQARKALDGKDIGNIQETLQHLREHSTEWNSVENEFNALLTRLGITREEIY